MSDRRVNLQAFATSASLEQLKALNDLLPAVGSIMARQGATSASCSVEMSDQRITIDIALDGALPAEATPPSAAAATRSAPVATPSSARRTGPLDDAEKSTIRAMHEEGAPAAEIAAKLNRATSPIALALHRLKAAASPPSEALEAPSAETAPATIAPVAPSAADVFRAACAEVRAERTGPIVDHLRTRHFKGGWDAAMDLQLLEMSIERVGLDVITMDLGRTAKEAKARLDYLLNNRTFKAAEVATELRLIEGMPA